MVGWKSVLRQFALRCFLCLYRSITSRVGAQDCRGSQTRTTFSFRLVKCPFSVCVCRIEERTHLMYTEGVTVSECDCVCMSVCGVCVWGGWRVGGVDSSDEH